MRSSMYVIFAFLAIAGGVGLFAGQSRSSANDISSINAGDTSSTAFGGTRESIRNFMLVVKAQIDESGEDGTFSARVTFSDRCQIETGNNDWCHLGGEIRAVGKSSAELTYEAEIRRGENSLRSKGVAMLALNGSQPTLVQIGDSTLDVWLKYAR